jgi:membrane-associated phospholipid phosphatase
MHTQSIAKRIISNLIPVDIATLGYLLITLIYILFSAGRLEGEWLHILLRIAAILLIVCLAWLSPRIRNELWGFLRSTYPIVLFTIFYAETDYLNNILFNNLDPFFERIELSIFGAHPSVLFSERFPQVWFSELMNLGYSSYYILIFLLPLWIWIKRRDSFNYVMFSIATSFYFFYLFFIIIPVAGPQFYLDEPLRTIPNSGLFRSLVRFAEWIGEGPTAAFPSSHVGVVLIMAILAYKYAKELLIFYVVFGLLICFSTVYIKAHYAIDVFGGIVFGVLFYGLSKWLFLYLSTKFTINHSS